MAIRPALILTLFLAARTAMAADVLISDIDDTIKVSHAVDVLDSAQNLPRLDNLFYGMNELYREIARQNPDWDIHYVSNAPRNLAWTLHNAFLLLHAFPTGTLSLREDWSDNTYKVSRIRAILQELNPQRVLFFGDNGERDPEVYAQIEREFTDVQFHTYIRTVENGRSVATAAQIAFVTPVEVALSLHETGLLPQPAENQIKRWIQWTPNLPLNQPTGTVAFPSWQNCATFIWPALQNPTTAPVLQHREFIRARCRP